MKVSMGPEDISTADGPMERRRDLKRGFRRAGRLLPDTNTPATRRRIIWALKQMSLTRSLYLSARYRGWLLVSRRTRLKFGPGSRISIPRGSFLFLGFANVNPTPCVVQLGRGALLSIQGTVNINRACRIYVNDSAHLSIGNRSYINDNSAVSCFERIAIGSGCSISWNTNILDANVHELVVDGIPRPRSQPVEIGDGVWLGSGAIVLPGVAIGSGAVVAAGSVVVSAVPGHTVVAGNPARVVRTQVSWRQ